MQKRCDKEEPIDEMKERAAIRTSGRCSSLAISYYTEKCYKVLASIQTSGYVLLGIIQLYCLSVKLKIPALHAKVADSVKHSLLHNSTSVIFLQRQALIERAVAVVCSQ